MKIPVKNFNLQHTLESGQFFRYDKKEEWYYCVERDKLFKIKQTGNTLDFEGTTPEHIKTLFGLNCNYQKIIRELSKDKTLLPALQKYSGLRIMQRDLWETIISFQCSIMSNIKKIKLNQNEISKYFGEKTKLDHYNTHTFPKPGQINDLAKIQQAKTGFRAKYIKEANEIITDNYLRKLKEKNYTEAKQELMKIPGIGPKVADCICLFALGHLNAFPTDVWINRMMTNLYFNGKETKMKEIEKFAINRWGENTGYAQQFLYHWGRNQ